MTNHARTFIRATIYTLLMLAALGLMMVSIGCTTVPPEAPSLPLDVTHQALCPEPAPLTIPAAITSAQLEELLAMAYWDLLAQYRACVVQQVKP